jgi:deoxyhypusine synthase
MTRGPVSQFIEHHYRHFNAAALMDAAKGYETHLLEGGKMMITLAGAMSTAELGISLAEMIRQGKVDIISCTGANLEEDIMNLVAHTHYKRVPQSAGGMGFAGKRIQSCYRHLHSGGRGFQKNTKAHLQDLERCQ